MATRSRELPGGKIVTWEVVPGGRLPFSDDLSPEGMALRSMVDPNAALAAVVEEKANPPKGPLRPRAPGCGRGWVVPQDNHKAAFTPSRNV